MLLSLKNGGNAGTWYNLDESWGYNAKWNKLVTKRQILCDFTYMSVVNTVVKFTEAESRMVDSRGLGSE